METIKPTKNKRRFAWLLKLLNWQIWIFIIATAVLIAFSLFTWQEYLSRDVALDKPLQVFSLNQPAAEQQQNAPLAAIEKEKNTSDKILLIRLLDADPYTDLLGELKEILPEQDYNLIYPYAAGAPNEAEIILLYFNWRTEWRREWRREWRKETRKQNNQQILTSHPHPILSWATRISGGRVHLEPRDRQTQPLKLRRWRRALDAAVGSRDYANALNIANSPDNPHPDDALLKNWQAQTEIYLRLQPIYERLRVQTQ